MNQMCSIITITPGLELINWCWSYQMFSVMFNCVVYFVVGNVILFLIVGLIIVEVNFIAYIATQLGTFKRWWFNQ